MATGLLVAAALAAIILTVFGAAERGIDIALQGTARWSFLLFWLAYVGRPSEKLFGAFFHPLAGLGREFGLAFAASMIVHVGLVLWLFYILTGPSGTMMLFWSGIFFTYLLALFSVPALRRALSPLMFGLVFTFGMEFIAFVFATDFILLPLQADTVKHPLGYIPFAIMLISAAVLRAAAFARSRFSSLLHVVKRT